MARSAPAADPAATIAALEAEGGEPFDPVRFAFIAALARRAAAQQGATRRLLDDKLVKLLADYRKRRAQAAKKQPAAKTADALSAPSGPLAALLAHIAQHAAPAPTAAAPATPATLARPQSELKSVSYFRRTWSKLSLEQQLAEALAQAPENAGPLNSHHLVLRSLERMRDVSPDYLQHFMSYVDTLFWLDQADSTRPAGQKGAAGGEADKKRKPARRSAGQ